MTFSNIQYHLFNNLRALDMHKVLLCSEDGGLTNLNLLDKQLRILQEMLGNISSKGAHRGSAMAV